MQKRWRLNVYTLYHGHAQHPKRRDLLFKSLYPCSLLSKLSQRSKHAHLLAKPRQHPDRRKHLSLCERFSSEHTLTTTVPFRSFLPVIPLRLGSA